MPRTIKRYEHKEVCLGNTDGLTKRQAEIAEMMAAGMTANEIGSALGISADTVNCHVDRLKDRFHAFNKADLLCQMWMHGILEARGMVAALVVGLCVISAFPMARSSRTSTRGSVRQEIRISKTARKELNVPIGVIA